MRVWEVNDAKALSGDMVQEQDFVMRLRVMHRQKTPQLIVNVIFGALENLHTDLALREKLQEQVKEAARSLNGSVHVMTNGECFVSLPLQSGQNKDQLIEAITKAALPDGANDEDAARLIHCYGLPEDYVPARERANYYIEAARAAAQIGAANPAPEIALQSDSVRGPLTPWALDQIIKLFEEIDIRRYVRSQTIHRQTAEGWRAAGAEYFVAADDLRRERFPRLDVHQPERLFMELCAALDRRLLLQLADAPESLPEGELFLNIAVESILDAPFARFTKAVSAEQRARMTFEINRGDLLLNLTTTLNAIAILRQEGFKLALDALHPLVLSYLNVEKFQADYYKVRVSKDTLEQLGQAEILEHFRRLPPEKIIFYRCDSESALAIGRQLGVTLFQGWLIDDVAHPQEAH